MAHIDAGSAGRGRWNRSPPVARIVDEHEDGIRALMAVDGAESHLTEYDRSAYRPADHSRTISMSRQEFHIFVNNEEDPRLVCDE
jgi:hypothetical protein